MADVTQQEGIDFCISLQPEVPYCSHLDLRPKQEDIKKIKRFYHQVKDGKADISDFINFLKGDRRSDKGSSLLKPYEPHCTKHDSLCIVMESPVISMQTYGALYQTLSTTFILNSNRIEDCEDREGREKILLGKFLLYNVVSQCIPEIKRYEL